MEPDAGGGVGAGRPGDPAGGPAEDPGNRLGSDHRHLREGHLVVRVSLSGVDREDVRITLSNSVLTVSGERRSELDEDDDVNFYVRERYYGAFRRSITLPAGINEDAISADFENGLLEVTVRGGATAAPEPRRIQIRDRSS